MSRDLATALRAAQWEAQHQGPFNHSGREITVCLHCRERPATVGAACAPCHATRAAALPPTEGSLR